MKEKINLNKIIWINTNIEWMRSVIYDYTRAGESLGMDYLSMGALRWDEKYFVGYIYDRNNVARPIDLVAYIQYEMHSNRLLLNYMEVSEKYRGNGIASEIINNFFASETIANYIHDKNVDVKVTSFSPDGKEASLMRKLQEAFPGTIVETSKRNIV